MLFWKLQLSPLLGFSSFPTSAIPILPKVTALHWFCLLPQRYASPVQHKIKWNQSFFFLLCPRCSFVAIYVDFTFTTHLLRISALCMFCRMDGYCLWYPLEQHYLEESWLFSHHCRCSFYCWRKNVGYGYSPRHIITCKYFRFSSLKDAVRGILTHSSFFTSTCL